MASTDWPRRIDICPWGFWYAANVVGGGGSPTRAQDSTNLSGGRLGTSGAPGAIGTYFEWKVPLGAGTWDIIWIVRQTTGFGIAKITFDGVDVATGIDNYNAVATSNVVNTITGIAVATSSVKTVRFEITGKNASATSYGINFLWINFKRTA